MKDLITDSKRRSSQMRISQKAAKRTTIVSFMNILAIQFWREIACAIYACLSPRNSSSAQAAKKPRRLYMPKELFKLMISCNLQQMARLKKETKRTKTRTRRIWSVTAMKKLQLVMRSVDLYREWPKVSSIWLCQYNQYVHMSSMHHLCTFLGRYT